MSYKISDARTDLNNIVDDENLFDRMIKVAAIVTSLMEGQVKQSDMPIIVGGWSMEIYTENEYTTHDIDFVTSAFKIIKENLLELGFTNNNRVFTHERLNVAVDIVDSALEPDDYDGVTKIETDKNKYIYVQSLENILFDRVMDYGYPDNEQYGVLLIAMAYEEIDFDYLKTQVKKADPDAFTALELWIEKALNR